MPKDRWYVSVSEWVWLVYCSRDCGEYVELYVTFSSRLLPPGVRRQPGGGGGGCGGGSARSSGCTGRRSRRDTADHRRLPWLGGVPLSLGRRTRTAARTTTHRSSRRQLTRQRLLTYLPRHVTRPPPRTWRTRYTVAQKLSHWLMWVNKVPNVLHGSVATHVGCGGIISRLLPSFMVWEFSKWVGISLSYRQEFGGIFYLYWSIARLCATVCI